MIYIPFATVIANYCKSYKAPHDEIDSIIALAGLLEMEPIFFQHFSSYFICS